MALLSADLEDLQRLVRTEDVVHHDHARPVHHADSNRGVGALGQSLCGDERPRAQLVEVQVGVSELQQPGPELVLPRPAVLLDEAMGLQRLQQAVHGGRRQLESQSQLGHAEAPRTSRERLEDASCAVDRLDARGPG
jgi:hypothetical protein